MIIMLFNKIHLGGRPFFHLPKFSSLFNLQDPDSVGRARALPPSRDTDDSVSGLDEAVLLAEVDAELDPVVDILAPVLVPVLLVVEGHHTPEDLHGAGGGGAAGDGQEGALRPVLGGDEGRPA